MPVLIIYKVLLCCVAPALTDSSNEIYRLGTLGAHSGSTEEKLPTSKVWSGFGIDVPSPLRTAVNTSMFDQ